MIPQDLFFYLPAAFYFIFLLPLFFILFAWLFSYREKMSLAFASKINLPKTAVLRSSPLYWSKVALLLLSWGFLSVALMQPAGNGHYVGEQKEPFVLKRKPHDLFFLIDASASMSIEAPMTKKTRLEMAKEIADEIIAGLQGESAALYAFTSEASKLSPATLDLFFVRMMLRQISINEGGIPGTDFSAALNKVTEKEFQDHEKLRTLIILSDGGDTSLDGLSGEQKISVLNQIADQIPDPKTFNMRTFTIGIGSLEKEPIPGIQYKGSQVYSALEEDLLKVLSEKGNGKYYSAHLLTPLDIAKALLQEMQPDDPYISEEGDDPKELIVYQLFFQVPLFIALIFLSLALFLPDSFSLKKSLPLLPTLLLFFGTLEGGKLDDELQKAKNFSEAGDAINAHNLYLDLLNQNLDPFEKAVVSYNLGTSLLENDQLGEAIEVLSAIPLTEKAPPFLTARTYMNLSLAKYRKAREELKGKTEASLEKAIYLLKLSQKDLQKAFAASCAYQKMEGREACREEPHLTHLREALTYWLKETTTKYGKPLPDLTSYDLFMKRINAIEEKAAQLNLKNLKELQNLLNVAVEMEHELLLQTRFSNQMEEEDKKSLEVLEKAQKETLALADRYLKNSFIIQEADYKTAGCQKKPWNEILPFYHKGYNAALEALTLIPINKEASALKQEEAIKYWRLAMQKSEKEEEKPPQKKEEPQDLKKDKASEKALEILQEMQAHDKKQKTSSQPLKQDVEKPW